MTRRAIPQAVKRQVRERANNCCEAEGCDVTEALQLHHVIEVNEGGENTVANLVLLCPAHHQPHTSRYAGNRRVKDKMAVRKSGYRTSTDKPPVQKRKIQQRANPWQRGRKLRS